MFAELFSYDPANLPAEVREQMAAILTTRGVLQRASADVSDLRARAWAGEEGLTEVIELKAADLAKLREDFSAHFVPFIKDSVDLDGLMEMLPMFALGVLSKFKVPPLLLLEAIGMDVDNLKLLADKLKEAFDEATQ